MLVIYFLMKYEFFKLSSIGAGIFSALIICSLWFTAIDLNAQQVTLSPEQIAKIESRIFFMGDRVLFQRRKIGFYLKKWFTGFQLIAALM